MSEQKDVIVTFSDAKGQICMLETLVTGEEGKHMMQVVFEKFLLREGVKIEIKDK